MHCKIYRADILERTCILRCAELAQWNPRRDITLGVPPYHRFGGCLKCSRGKDLIERIKQGENVLTADEKIKKCSKCQEAKPHSEFYTDPKSPDKKGYWCKQCSKEASKDSKKKKQNPSVKSPSKHVEKQEFSETEAMNAAMETLFAHHQDLLENIKRKAKEEFRHPAMQVLYMINNLDGLTV